jgi:hypothetical protein
MACTNQTDLAPVPKNEQDMTRASGLSLIVLNQLKRTYFVYEMGWPNNMGNLARRWIAVAGGANCQGWILYTDLYPTPHTPIWTGPNSHLSGTFLILFSILFVLLYFFCFRFGKNYDSKSI